MIYLFDKNKEMIQMTDEIIASEQESTKNGLITHVAEFKHMPETEEAQFFGMVDVDNPEVFWMYRIDLLTTSGATDTIRGTYVLFDDLNGRGGIIKDRRPNKETATSILTSILANTGWSIGSMNTTNTASANYYYVSKSEAFFDFLESWNVEFKPRMTYGIDANGIVRITGKYIDIYNQLSGDFGKWYEYGSDLLSVTKEFSSNHIYTAYIGRGKGEEVGETEAGDATFGRKISFADIEWKTTGGKPVDKPKGQDYVELPVATQDYGYEDGSPRFTIVEFNDIEDKEELLEATYQYALDNSRPRRQFKSTVIENGLAELGETVAIIDDERSIRYKTRIFKLKRDFLNKRVKEIEFGDTLVANVAQRQVAISKKTKEIEQQQLEWLEVIFRNITDSYFNEDGYNYDLQAGNEYNLPGGYYSFNAPIDQSPSKVIYMGAGQLLIANSKNPDGTWNWRTAATGDGIVADVINSGTLRTVMLEGGNNPQNNYWNLASGDFRLGDNRSYLGWNPATRRLEMVWEDTDTSISIGDGSLTSTAEDGSQTYVQNGIVGFRNPQGASLGHMGYIDAGNSPWYNINTSLGTNFSIRSNIRMGDGSTYPYQVLQVFPGSSEMYINLDDTRMRALYANAINVDGRVDMTGYSGGRIIQGANALKFQGGGDLRVVSDNSRMHLEASSQFNLWSNGSRVFHTDSSHMYMNRTLSMEGNNITNQSDIRLKEDIKDAEVSGIDETKRLRMVEFNWKKNHPATEKFPTGKQFGMIAQDTPFLSTQDQPDNHYMSIDMFKQINLATLTNQELIERNEKQEEKITELETELSDLKQLLIDKGVI